MTAVIAHRGASEDAPENTLEAFELAIQQRADMIETDLHQGTDGSIPIWHDADLEGAPIDQLTLAQIRQRQPSVPTLEETLDACGARIPFNLEIKASASGEYSGLEARTLEVVWRRGLLEQTLFSSFALGVLRRLRELEPRARIGVLLPGRTLRVSRIEELARQLGAEAIHPSLRRVDCKLVERLHAKGFRVNVYTVDAPERQRELVDWGVDGIFTNRPAQLRALLEGRGGPSPSVVQGQ